MKRALYTASVVALAGANACGGSSAVVGDASPTDAHGVIDSSVADGRPDPNHFHYYVSVSGSDATGDGSAAHPWASIDKAADALTLGSSGTTVHVGPGTYAPAAIGSNGVATTRSGTASARIQYLSDVKWGARIAPTGAYFVWNQSGDFVDIDGFEVVGDAASNVGIYSVGSNDRIRGNHVHGIPATTGCGDGNGGAGIDAGNYTAHDVDIIGNLVHDVGPFPANGLPVSNYCNGAHGIYHALLRGHIANNISFRNAAWGIHLWHAANNVIIENNVSFNNGAKTDVGNTLGGGILFGAGDAPGGVTTDNVTVANNIVYSNRGDSIREYGTTGASNRVLANVVYGNGNNTVLMQTGSASGTITADPLFVNYQPNGGGDYHVASGSVAINAGTTACAPLPGDGNCAPTFDYDGGMRPTGSALDIGAFEAGATPATWPWY